MNGYIRHVTSTLVVMSYKIYACFVFVSDSRSIKRGSTPVGSFERKGRRWYRHYQSAGDMLYTLLY